MVREVESPGEQAIRAADLAAELDLSTATVSRALNGSPSVRPEVAARVRTHARQRGYVPNRLARSLAARSTAFVGFLVPDVENLTYSIAAGSCAQVFGAHGYQLILGITGDDPHQEHEALLGLKGAQIAGVIASPSASITDDCRAALAQLPTVEYNRTAGLADDGVFCDERSGFAAATRYLLDLGHTDIAYVGTTSAVSNGRQRLDGFHSALTEAGLSLQPERVRLVAPAERHGYDALRQMLGCTGRWPTALVVGSSSLSVGVVRACQDLGLAIPEQLSLVVYGDPEWSALVHPKLTTIAVPYREMAEAAAELILGLVGEGGDEMDHAATPGQRYLDAPLVVRDSTAPPGKPLGIRGK